MRTLCDITLMKDVAVPLRDGTIIYIDIYLPKGAGDVPVIVSWSPYGKGNTGGFYDALRWLFGVKESGLSGYEKREAVDPGYWCSLGYAVCQPDARGACNSEGDIFVFGKQEGEDANDLIEWLGVQPWCNGNVGLAGDSWLAASQWFTAAEQPPHLKAIAPWEGFSDMYRDLTCVGGIPDYSFMGPVSHNLTGHNNTEDIAENGAANPFYNDYWRTKTAKFEKIQVPVYESASYSNTVHTFGEFRAWHYIASKEKWLRIHDSEEWPDFYDPEHQLDLKRFFDHYLKGEDNGWESTPRVRYSVLDMHDENKTDIPAESFPPEEAKPLTLWLNAADNSLQKEDTANEDDRYVSYDSEKAKDIATFDMEIDEDMTLIGYPTVSLWVEAKDTDDMDLFLILQKLDEDGKALTVTNPPHPALPLKIISEKHSIVARYHGPLGRCRASLRKFEYDADEPWFSNMPMDEPQKLEDGEIVEVLVRLMPMAMSFKKGEKLRLLIAGTNVAGTAMPLPNAVNPYKLETINKGIHCIYTSKSCPSKFQVKQL